MLSVPDFLVGALRGLHFRGKYRLLNALVPSRGERDAEIFGYSIKLELGELIQRRMYLGAFEERETMLARRYLKAGMTVVDVGANVGYYTALAASIVGPAGRVFAIEPSPRAFCRLCELIRHNGIGQARAFQFGLSDAPGELPIYLGNLSNHTPTMIAHDALPPAATVPVATFDDCLEKWGLDIIDLLKIDIEGWEPKVFAGATSALRSRRIKAVLCEFNEPWLRAAGSSAISLWQILADAGFRPYGKQIKLPLAPVETAMLILGEDN